MTNNLSGPTPRHFIDLHETPAAALRAMLDVARAMKSARAGWPKGQVEPDAPLAGHSLAMIFEKSSTRTRVSFEMAMQQLGGKTIVMQGNDMQLGRGEPVSDTAKVLSRYVDAIMLRSNSHEALLELARHASVPVINALTDFSHPCQVMADVMTFEEHKGPIKGRVITWVGDGNNMAVSWIHAAARFGCELRLACPAPYRPAQSEIDWANQNGGKVILTEDPIEAARDSDCLIADTWVSMGDKDIEERLQAFQPYQVNDQLMAVAAKDAIFMHCLPAYRGKEVSAEMLDGPQSVIWDEAENRLHAQKGILMWCLGKI
ncbi:ornithine carbamoyltransferase [Govanella unica]|uniref:Ornithine carbamoyltransferase n=1 Tax=Govanella unica TaxID=2975056 RepID=A0A9X3Z875_9PROT|nr:ornithine carbamoyltransferase [Govania unica]MDA5194793.1 ornithine carbamoyltransferase [Govania unica]